MKVAMWGLLLFILGIGAIVLINIFGNITTTNQQDYTLIKNTVEASMHDAIDKASYRAGFYLCTNKTKDEKGIYNFNSTSEYAIISNNIEDVTTLGYRNCDFLENEIKLNKDVFMESFLRRFAANINNNKSYQVTIQEVIEYPPKVSVRIDTFNTYNSTGSTTLEFDEGDFNIRNQIDAIFEEKN